MVKKEKKLLGITLSVIFMSFIYLFLLEPLYKQVTVLNQEINLKQARLTKNLELLKEKDMINEELKKYGHLFKAKGSAEEEMASLLAEIGRISKSAGIYLSDVKPQRSKDKGFFKIMLVEIRYQATLPILSKFIYEIQNSPFLLKASRLQITSQASDSKLLEGVIQISKISIP